ncbi:MAG: TraB/VirB10 family protein [Proteobacteria bacterium]|nr:TraB/VirB10 family protein [Pseudomonadota bacterium]
MSLGAIKQNQMKVLYGLLIVLSVLVFGMGYLLLEKGNVSPQKATNYKSSLISATSQIDPKEIWVERMSQEAQLNQKRIDSLEKGVETIVKTMESKVEQPLPLAVPTTNLQNGENVVTGIRSDIKALQNDDFVERGKGQTIHSANAPVLSSEEIKKVIQKRAHTKGIQRTSISLVHSRGQKPLKTFDNTIPAGTFAKAVLLGGVDASTSIHASNDPRPILLRITDHGNLPRKFRSDVCDCHVLAATYGDISSERVYMRLEKLTCVERRTGEVLEMNVTGYVAGEDGRAGLRGDIVDRAGESVRAAAVGGFIGGMANFMAQSNNNPTTFSLQSGLSQTNPLTNGEILKQGASKGATTAMEKYADFYIKRAEQMQPVISVEAGRIADIVFTQGVAFEDSAARSALVRSSDQTRYQQIQESQTETKPVEAWVPKREG